MASKTTDPVAKARARLAEAHQDLSQFNADWQALKAEDREFTRTSRLSDKADPAWHRTNAELADSMEAMAIRSLEVRSEYDRAEEALRLTLAEHYEELREKHQTRLHQLGIDLDVMVDGVAAVVAEILWGSSLANLLPGHQDTWVDYNNDNRAPLLFISGGEDHLMPPSVQRSNAKHYKSNTITEVKEYDGKSHLMPSQEGWEEVADYALNWALDHATAKVS